MTNTKFKFDILENTEEGIVQVGEKEVYNLDGGEIGLNEWSKDKNVKKIKQPILSSALVIKNDGKETGKFEVGVFYSEALTVTSNTQCVYMMSTNSSKLSNIQLNKSNFKKGISAFCARRLVENEVWNWNDEYMKPSDDTLASDDYKQWSNDCIIYSLSDNKSYQSSLRQVTYQGKQWNIKNEFFPFSPKELRTLAENNQFIEMIDDLDEDDSERFVYTEIERIKLEPITFSQEALDLLNSAKQLLIDSMPQRKQMHSQHEEYHLHAWDSGYAQLKLVWKEHFAKEFKVFDGLRKALADKLRPKVYEFGFLYK